MGTLYLVATPIGNLDDISKRALGTLAGVDLILAEDTRVSGKLLGHYGIKTQVASYHQHSGEGKMLEVLSLLLGGKDVALVSDAGTPGIADPGNELVDFINENSEVQIIPVPGPSAVTAALSVCGFNVSKYLFLGFWPKKKVSKAIKLIKLTKTSLVFFESPHRIVKTLEKLHEAVAQRRVFIGRELTKMHETHYRGSLDEVIIKLKSEKFLKGELVVVVE